MNDLRQNAPNRKTSTISALVLGALMALGGLILMMRPDPTVFAAVVHWTLRVTCGIILVGSLWNIWRLLYPPKQ
jgi:hypothetical protein